jgi:glycosyltransferase involved in cell wall biosynthesis
MSADAVGGVWTYALELAHALGQTDIDVQLAILGPRPSQAQRRETEAIGRLSVVATDLPLDWTAKSEMDLVEANQELRALARRAGAELAHLNAPAHAAGTRWPLPLVVAAHSCVATWWRALKEEPLPNDLAWRAAATARGLRRADVVLVPSHAFARVLADTYGAGFPLRSVHNGTTPRRLPPAPTKDCILTAGRLWDPAKNLAVLDAAAALSGKHIHAAGPIEGPHREQVDLANLKLLGSLTQVELAHWYARAAIFVSVPKYEPFGLAVLEAAQAGAALVLADIATLRELWDGAALFVAPEDSYALADAIAWLANAETARSRLAHKAQARAKAFTVDRMLAGTLSAYEHALRQHAHTRSVEFMPAGWQ